ncbi:MAG: fatty acid desaturase [Bdellovibrionota bacterium]
MNPVKTFLRIQKDPAYLLKNYLLDLFMTLTLIVVLKNILSSSWDLSSAQMIFLTPFAMIWGCLIASFLHNASHANVGGNLLNRMVGEFCGAWVLYGYSNFIMIHHLHHRYSDEKHDPVHPGEMNFLVFLSAPMRYMIVATKGWLRERHGHEEKYETLMEAQTVIFHINLVLKIVLWHTVFGTDLFLAFYVPALLANYGILAHINYVCHRENEDGSVEIVNLNHNLYYRFANFITFGGYYHKNHHLRLNVFNPMKMESARAEERLFTIGPQRLPYRIYKTDNVLKNYFDLQVWGEARKSGKRSGDRRVFNVPCEVMGLPERRLHHDRRRGF